MRVLVTGSSGFIGARAAARLIEDGAEVITAGRSPPSGVGVHAHEVVDLLRPGQAEALAGRVRASHLLHLAWNATPGLFWNAPDNLDWAAATLVLLRAFAASGGRRAVFAGTCAEYAWDRAVLSEADPTEPATFYGRIKDATRRAVCAAGTALPLSVAWGRVFWLYGPREQSGRLVSDIAAAQARGEPALTSDGAQARDFLHVDDVAGAFVSALSSDWSGPFNIGSGEAVRIRDLVVTIAAAIGRPELLRLGALPSRPNEPPTLAADVRILRSEIGFRPRISLADGLDATARWHLETMRS